MPSFERHVLALMAGLALALSGLAEAADETLVRAFLSRRLGIAENPQLDPNELSLQIRTALVEAERMERGHRYQAAIYRLGDLQRFMPVDDIPSHDLHASLARLHSKVGNTQMAQSYQARADALRELLTTRVGSGATPADPVRYVLNQEIQEWAAAYDLRITGIEQQVHQGREMTVMRYELRKPGQPPRQAWFEMVRLTAPGMARGSILFTPIALERLPPEYRRWVEVARARREAFLADTRFSYSDLLARSRSAMDRAAQLDTQYRPHDALAALREIESLRPLEDIPLPHLISSYAALLGKNGDTTKQAEVRGLLFGICQVIAHSGDARAPESAIHVIAVDEEYVWLTQMRLQVVSQRTLVLASGKYDVVTARDTTGVRREYFFNVTRLSARHRPGEREPAKSPRTPLRPDQLPANKGGAI